MNNYFLPFKKLDFKKDLYCNIENLGEAKVSSGADENMFKLFPISLYPVVKEDSPLYEYTIGEYIHYSEEIEEQGYVIIINKNGILVKASDELGFRYGIDSFIKIFEESQEKLNCMEIYDYPTLKKRGLMLDISRGKVYTLDYLLDLMDLLKKLRFNVFQLYIEHTFQFSKHRQISKGSSPITPEDILILQNKCEENGIELQANLQSLGHMNRILTRPEYMHLAESEMYWSIDTTNEESYDLLDDMYEEFLPLFKSQWLNICSDEPYDLGKGKSEAHKKEVGELYFDHLLKLHDLANKYGKKIMLFGDVVKQHPEYAEKMPKDVIYIDWIYDPKEEYKTPGLFQKTGIPYWVSPGTGNWNTLFPRLEGSLTNIKNLTLEGIENGAEGMLLTDWNDHGGYTQPGPTYYSYAYGAAISWTGRALELPKVDKWIDSLLNMPMYSQIIHKLGSIYNIVPIWSKNRSECVMALFDEPIFGNAIRGPKPPKELKAYDLKLPEGIEPVMDRHSQHPLRPYFSIPDEARSQISNILKEVEELLSQMKNGRIKSQLVYISNAFSIMIAKIELGKEIIYKMENRVLNIEGFLKLEDKVRLMIKDYIKLQMDFTNLWFEVARHSEIEISLVYFAHIISRLDYLRDWLSIQRENFHKEGVDWKFKTYNTGDYTTLPTY